MTSAFRERLVFLLSLDGHWHHSRSLANAFRGYPVFAIVASYTLFDPPFLTFPSLVPLFISFSLVHFSAHFGISLTCLFTDNSLAALLIILQETSKNLPIFLSS